MTVPGAGVEPTGPGYPSQRVLGSEASRPHELGVRVGAL